MSKNGALTLTANGLTTRVYFGFAMPRRGRQLEVLKSSTAAALHTATMTAFESVIQGSQSYSLCLALCNTHEVIGDIADLKLPPYDALVQLEQDNTPVELVLLPRTALAAATPDADDIDNAVDDDDEATLTQIALLMDEATSSRADDVSSAEFDPRRLDRVAANQIADKLARRVAKLSEFVAGRDADDANTDPKLRRQLQRVTAEIEKRCAQLVLVEQLLAEIDIATTDDGDGDESSISEVATRVERVRVETSQDDSDSTAKKKKVRTKRSADLKSSSSSTSSKAVVETNICGMCGETFSLDVRSPRWVYVPSSSGAMRLTVCSGCRRALASDPSVRTTDDPDSPTRLLFEMRQVGALGPATPTVFDRLHVPRFVGAPQFAYQNSEFVVPDVVVSRFKKCGTLHIASLQRPGIVLLPNDSAVLSACIAAPFSLTYHENETLQVYNVVTCLGDASTLNCRAAFANETSSRTRAIVANERWIVVMSKERLCVWPWRVVLAHKQHDAEPVRTIMFGEASDNPRDDFSSLDGHRLLVGCNQSFSVFDLLSGNCISRFSMRLQRADAVTSAFYGIQFAGEAVLTHEQGGVRVWRSAPGDGTSPRSDDVLSADDAPPLITAVGDDAIISTVYADAEWLVLGDNFGRLRVRPVAAASASTGRQGKLKAILGGDIDAERVPVEFLNSQAWIAELSAPKKGAANKAASAAASGGRKGGLRKMSNFMHKVNFIERHGNRIFCAQENGLFSVWDLLQRNADHPITSYQCAGPIRSFRSTNGSCMLGVTELTAEEATPVSDDNANEQYLTVVVCDWSANRFRIDALNTLPTLPPPSWRAIVLVGADSLRATESGDRDWYWNALQKFSALAGRATTQQSYIVCVTANSLDSASRAVTSLPDVTTTTLSTMKSVLGELYSPSFSATWHEPTASAPTASLVVLPGAEPFNPIAAQVVINVDGFIKSYAVYARFGVPASPAKVWAYINKLLIVPTVQWNKHSGANAANASKEAKKPSKLAALFKIGK